MVQLCIIDAVFKVGESVMLWSDLGTLQGRAAFIAFKTSIGCPGNINIKSQILAPPSQCSSCKKGDGQISKLQSRVVSVIKREARDTLERRRGCAYLLGRTLGGTWIEPWRVRNRHQGACWAEKRLSLAGSISDGQSQGGI